MLQHFNFHALDLNTSPSVAAVTSNAGGTSRTLEVVSTLSDPYTMIKMDALSHGRTGNDKYEGFAVDLVQEISNIVGFNFTLTPSSGYGSKREDGSWTGMIGEITEGRADMAIGDMRDMVLMMNIERKMFNHLFSILELSSEIN